MNPRNPSPRQIAQRKFMASYRTLAGLTANCEIACRLTREGPEKAHAQLKAALPLLQIAQQAYWEAFRQAFPKPPDKSHDNL